MNAIQALPEIFQLTPVRDKKPYTRQWQTTDIPRRDIADAIASGKATGFGLRLGVPSSGVMALDIDGAAPRALLAEIMGAGELPMTVEFTSGKPDRSQMLFQVPEQYWDALKPKKKSIASGDTTEDLDFRWNGNQSVLPPSAHPETDGYQWIEGKSPDDVSIAELPTTLLEYWLNLIDPPRIAPAGKVASTKRAKSFDSTPTGIPIERLLTKAHRDALGGVFEGSRDNMGIELACDLIGVESLGSIECDYKGKNYTLEIEQNARELFTDYCRGCNPPLEDRDEDRIWNSASQRDGEPSNRDEDAMKNCARSYLKELIGTTRSTGSKRQASAPVKNESGCDYPALAQRLGITLLQDDRGNVQSKLVELTLNLFNLLGERLKLNQMTNEYEFEGKLLDLNHIKSFISQNLGCDSSTENCIQAVHAIASRFAFHPVRDYLDALKDSPVDFEVFDNLATLFLGNSDPLANRMLAKTLIGAVARVKQPGTKVDTLTVLQGGQGYLKSTFLKVLAGDAWFCDDIRDLENKDEIAKLARYWLIELAEVDYLMGRKEVESFKRFLSTTADTYRPPYGRSNVRHERTCALFATTNKSEFLKDPTGNRRYWVIRVEAKIDCAAVAKIRDIIWATALAAYDRGDTWWLDDNEESQRAAAAVDFQEIDPWQEAIESKWVSIPLTERDDLEMVQVDSIFQVLDVPIERRTQASRNRIGSILRNLGFENKPIWLDGKTKKLFVRFKSLVEKTGKAGKEVAENITPHGISALPVSESKQVRTGKEIETSEAKTTPQHEIHALPESLPESLPNLTRPNPSFPHTLEKKDDSEKIARIEVGDRVRVKTTGEVGLLSKWYRDRSKATIDTTDGISDWIPVKNLERLEVA
jgi:predicted P-loop ATPase